ncbi:MAG: FadR family transcriptional regulator [Synergistaceae bacterium]|nr:FadR family transcriptional regulator [Synergistaceae bacterium]
MNENKLLASQVAEKLLTHIKNDNIKIGEKIENEFELADLFCVSRNTVREAIKLLVSKGVLDVKRGSGTYVISETTIDEDPLRLGRYSDKIKLALELFDVRLVLESEIAACAALNATDEEIEEMQNLCIEIENLHKLGKDTTLKDTELHTKIAKSSKNRIFEELTPLIVSGVFTSMTATKRKLISHGIEAHKNIVAAIARHDPKGARFSMIEHLNSNRNFLLEMLNK